MGDLHRLALVMATDFCICGLAVRFTSSSRARANIRGMYWMSAWSSCLSNPSLPTERFSDQLPLLVHDQYRSTHHVSLRAGFIERPAFTGNFVDCAAWVV